MFPNIFHDGIKMSHVILLLQLILVITNSYIEINSISIKVYQSNMNRMEIIIKEIIKLISISF